MTTHHMKMAKATKEDLAAAIELYRFLDMINADWSNGDDLADLCVEDGLTGYKDCVEPFDYVLKAFGKGGLNRVIMGMQVLLDPQNEIVDPNLDHLELHPRFAKPDGGGGAT